MKGKTGDLRDEVIEDILRGKWTDAVRGLQELIDLDAECKEVIRDKIINATKCFEDVEVVLDIQKFRNIAELILNMKGKNMVVKEEAATFEQDLKEKRRVSDETKKSSS